MAVVDRNKPKSVRLPGGAPTLARPRIVNDPLERSQPIERAIFWLFIASIAWVPFWYGSNDWLAWGVNAVVFPGLAGFYELSLLIRNKPHPVALSHLAVPFALFTAVVLWIAVQVIGLPNSSMANPIWGMAADALGHPVVQSISVNRDLTVQALMRLVTAASAFWLAVQLCRNSQRANSLIVAIGAIGAAYALYGLLAMKFGQLALLGYIPSSGDKLNSTFINPDSYATYSAIGFIAIAGLVLRFYGEGMSAAAGNWRFQLASFIEQTGGQGAALLGGGFLILTALLLTGSRGGVIAGAFGLFVLVALATRRSDRATGSIVLLVICFALVAATLFVFGNVVGGKLADSGIYDGERFSVYLLTLRSIFNKPLLGFGYGTFPDVFPMYRDHSIEVLGTWNQAHNTYLEIFQGLGVLGGALLIGCVLVLIARCIRGTMRRQQDVTIPCIAASAAFVVAAHALVDFSLQMQAVALTFIAVLGAGVAQSESSQLALED